jgi:pyruvate/2-oxoglutarate dehydrogenase complex dihydrolipoamide acyltransferase (E2) component
VTRVVPQRIPDLGEFRDVEIVDVLVKVGDTIDVDSPLITLETDKATMDVPATAAGVVQELKVAKGDRVSKDSLIALIAADSSDTVRLPSRRQRSRREPLRRPPAATVRLPT